MLIGSSTDGINLEAKVCRLIGFDPTTYELVEELSEMTYSKQENADNRFSEDPPT